MPWAARVPAILEAWYPGTAGGEAIANLLSGRVNPSGHLPVTFPLNEAQLPRPVRPGIGPQGRRHVRASIIPKARRSATNGSTRKRLQPLFPFGHGLSYTSFAYGPISAAAAPNGGLRVQIHACATPASAEGMAVGQVYASPASGGWEAPKRLGGYRQGRPGARRIADCSGRRRSRGCSRRSTRRHAPGASRRALHADARRLVARSARRHDGRSSRAQSAGELAAGTGSRCPSRPARRARSIRIRPSRGPAGSTGTGAPSSTASATAS